MFSYILGRDISGISINSTIEPAYWVLFQRFIGWAQFSFELTMAWVTLVQVFAIIEEKKITKEGGEENEYFRLKTLYILPYEGGNGNVTGQVGSSVPCPLFEARKTHMVQEQVGRRQDRLEVQKYMWGTPKR